MRDGFFQLCDTILGHGRVIPCPVARAQRKALYGGKL
jgi:hypothetical protein